MNQVTKSHLKVIGIILVILLVVLLLIPAHFWTFAFWSFVIWTFYLVKSSRKKGQKFSEHKKPSA